METESPDFRVTLRRDGVVRLVDWVPWLTTGGPLHTLLDARGRAGVCIADLTVVRDDDGTATELVVDVRCGDRPAHRQALVDWAARVGYRRVWMDGEVIDVAPTPGGRAETRCSGCRVRLVDAGVPFWDFVRQRGAFPAACCLCGADLPQWTVARQTPAPDDDPASSPSPRRTTCR
jgi:hypothetical protein